MPNSPSYSATTEYPGERSECFGFGARCKSRPVVYGYPIGIGVGDDEV